MAEADNEDRKAGVCENGRLPGGDVIFESRDVAREMNSSAKPSFHDWALAGEKRKYRELNPENGRLPAADAGFQSIGMLFVNELEREALFQIADNAGEHLAECDLGL